jgi:hypothetical protein
LALNARCFSIAAMVRRHMLGGGDVPRSCLGRTNNIVTTLTIGRTVAGAGRRSSSHITGDSREAIAGVFSAW